MAHMARNEPIQRPRMARNEPIQRPREPARRPDRIIDWKLPLSSDLWGELALMTDDEKICWIIGEDIYEYVKVEYEPYLANHDLIYVWDTPA